MEIVVALHDIRSTYNVGAILRTAEGFGIKKVVFSGYTPMPVVGNATDVEYCKARNLLPHLSQKITRQIAKTALGAEKLLTLEWSGDIASLIQGMKAEGYIVVGLENNLEDARVYSLNTPHLEKVFGPKVVLVLGEEVKGISKELLDQMDYFLTIPMLGRKESFNVSVATGISLYRLTVGAD